VAYSPKELISYKFDCDCQYSIFVNKSSKKCFCENKKISLDTFYEVFLQDNPEM